MWIALLVERPTDSNSTQVRRTWGPSSVHKKDKVQHHQTLSPVTNGWLRWSRSAPNLPKTLSCMGDQAVVRAFTDLGLCYAAVGTIDAQLKAFLAIFYMLLVSFFSLFEGFGIGVSSYPVLVFKVLRLSRTPG